MARCPHCRTNFRCVGGRYGGQGYCDNSDIPCTHCIQEDPSIMQRHFFNCPSNPKNQKGSATIQDGYWDGEGTLSEADYVRLSRENPEGIPTPDLSGFVWKKLADGTFLIAHAGDNIHKSHWHVAKDGTVLSIKEGGSHSYKRSDVMRKLNALIPDLNLSFLYRA